MNSNIKVKLNASITRKGITARKYDKMLIQRRNKIRELYIRNHSQEEISLKMNISQSTVSRDIDHMRERLDNHLENIDVRMLEENFKSQLSLEEQIEKLYISLDNPKLEEKDRLKSLDMLLKLFDKKEYLFSVRLDLFRFELRLKRLIDKEEELRKKEKMLEAEKEGRKLSWNDIWIRVDDNAIA